MSDGTFKHLITSAIGDISVAESERREHTQYVKAAKCKGTAFKTALNVETERAARYRRPLSLAIFRLVRKEGCHASIWNTQRRHFLANLAVLATDILRIPDFFAPLDGHIFAIAFPETRRMGAITAAEHFFKSIDNNGLLKRFDDSISGLTWTITEHGDEARGDAFLQKAMESA